MQWTTCTGSRLGRARLVSSFGGAGVTVAVYNISHEHTVDDSRCDTVNYDKCLLGVMEIQMQHMFHGHERVF